MRRSHRPRACAPSYQQCYESTIDGPMQFAFANPLRLPTSEQRPTVGRWFREERGLPTLRQATCRTLRRQEVRLRLWAAADSGVNGFVSYFSFVSNEVRASKVHSYLVALTGL